MSTLFLYAREADTDPAGRRFKLGLATVKGLDISRSDRPERSYASLNDLCAALCMAVETPIDHQIVKLRREVSSNFDFVMKISESDALRLGFKLT